jgi:hypothetical protein
VPTEFTVEQGAAEKGTFAVTVSFTDEDGNAITPNSGLKWSLVKDDRITIVNNRENVAISPGTSITIVLSGDDLVKDPGELVTWRYLVTEGTYNGTLGSDLPINDHLRFPIVDIAKVPN